MRTSDESLKAVVSKLLAKPGVEPLQARWDEACSFGAGAEADAYWVRESEDVINIVWYNAEGIRDITFIPPKESMFNFVPLSSVATIEVREIEDVASARLGVRGSYMVHVIVTTRLGDLYWVASSPSETDSLKRFLSHVLTAYSRVKS